MDCPKLVVLDLDGTAVGYNTTHVAPTPAIIKTLADVQEAGVPVAIATGRAIWGAIRTVEDLGLTNGLISATHGAVTYDVARNSVIASTQIDPSAAVQQLLAANPDVAFAVEMSTNGWRHTQNFTRDFDSNWADVVDVDVLASTMTARLAARIDSTSDYGKNFRCPAATELASAAALNETEYTVEIGFKGWLDIGPPKVNKATGVATIAEYYGVAAKDTIVFGDAANDLPMFEWAGHAVAMGNAVDEVKNFADEIAPSVYEDGVAAVLKRWFP